MFIEQRLKTMLNLLLTQQINRGRHVIQLIEVLDVIQLDDDKDDIKDFELILKYTVKQASAMRGESVKSRIGYTRSESLREENDSGYFDNDTEFEILGRIVMNDMFHYLYEYTPSPHLDIDADVMREVYQKFK